ncbi:MAG: crotonase/enoyl-CoA hydratase family protein [Deltaproteobacteria bacterium]|nr:crotonase/enoyl-CoA hydratase family protein [Deltaproteobacteria bacterium]
MPNDTYESVTVEIKHHIATVTMRATGKAPRMGPAYWREFPQVFAQLDADDTVRVVLLRGEGAHFSTGLDLGAMAGELAPLLLEPSLVTARRKLYDTIVQMQAAADAVAACRKPVIAAIAGHCLGGGVDLATACDVRICSTDATFSVREVRLAIVADVGTLARLPMIVGQGLAREWCLTGDDIDAETALRAGLVSRLSASPEALFASAQSMAERIAKNPPLTVQGIKHVLNDRSEREARESLRHVALYNAAFLPSEDLREALSAWMEKREPNFEGR